jgi:hypothetical protein
MQHGEDEMTRKKKPKNPAANEATIDADTVGRAVDDLLQKDQLENDKGRAGNKPRAVDRPDFEKAAELNRDHHD